MGQPDVRKDGLSLLQNYALVVPPSDVSRSNLT